MPRAKKAAPKQSGAPKSQASRPKSAKAAAVALGYSRQTLDTWFHEGAPGKGDDGTYDLEAIRVWKESRPDKREKPTIEASSGKGEINDPIAKADLEWKQARVERAKFELEVARGGYIERADVEMRDTVRIKYLRNALLSLAKKLAIELANKTTLECEVILTTNFRGLCDAYSAF